MADYSGVPEEIAKRQKLIAGETHPVKEPQGLSIKGTYADAILASRQHLEEAERMGVQSGWDQAGSKLTVDGHLKFAEAWARLAVACQKVPGSRF